MVNRIPGAEPGSDAAKPAGIDDVRRNLYRDEADKEWHGLLRAWRALGIRIPRLRAEASRYIAARVDLVKSKVARTAEGALVGVVALIVGVAVLATAGTLMVLGIAGGIAQALDGNVWAGNLLTGAGLLVLLAAAITIVIGRKRAARLKRLEQRYAEFDRASAVPGGNPGTEPAPAHAATGTNGAVP